MTTSSKTKQLLFVLGVHRSGTSALCAALAAAGASFGSRLIGAMAGVNDEGFWEDAGVVAINEQLLALLDSSWFAPQPGIADTDWTAARFQPAREEAERILRAGFGDAPLQAVKDPRLCLTLPFWLTLCTQLDIPARVCVIRRAPLEVAQSLEKRDGLPLGYGLRLYTEYEACIDRFVPADTLYLRYDDLLQDAPAVMGRLSATLPLEPATAELSQAVRSGLRHHQATTGGDLLSQSREGKQDLSALEKAIEQHYPLDTTLREFSARLVERGQELAAIGAAHSTALATLDERDADIEALSGEHRQALATIEERDSDIESLAAEHRKALATIDERDEQIREFDRRLSQLGDEHTHALEVLRQRDAELAWLKQRLETISKIPGVGYLIRRLRQNAQG